MTSTPPNGGSIYKLLTGPDDASFCEKVSEALTLGYKLHGSPTITFNGQTAYAAQAVIWPTSSSSARQQNVSDDSERGERNFNTFRPHKPRDSISDGMGRRNGPRRSSNQRKSSDRGGFGDGFKSSVNRFDEDVQFKKHLSRSTNKSPKKW